MKASILSSLALAAAISAKPLPDVINPPMVPPAMDAETQKSLELVMAFAEGRVDEMLGGPKATEQLTQFARILGAAGGKTGSMGLFVKDFLNSGYGKVDAEAGDVPARSEMEARNTLPGSKTVKMRYGPYKVPSMKKKNLVGEEGSLFNYPDMEWERPCDGKCTILGVEAGLEYQDGKNANIDTGMWLHHMVLFTSGPDRQDVTCKQLDVSLPHILVNQTSKTSERFLASGNERTPFMFPAEMKVGYKMNPEDRFHAIIDLMNENMVDHTVYLTVTFDYVDGHPAGFDNIKPVWLDVQQCGTSEIVSPHKDNIFSIPYDWTSDLNGEILGAGGHLHDGGSHLTLALDGKQLCNSKATYGGSAEFMAPADAHSAHSGVEHISSMSPCIGFIDFAGVPLKAGQKWRLEAHYDYNQHKPSMHGNGGFDKIMGIALMYVRVKE